MAGNNLPTVICCFCGEPELNDEALTLRVSAIEMGNEAQVLFAHKKCFVRSLHSSVPLHPALVGAVDE